MQQKMYYFLVNAARAKSLQTSSYAIITLNKQVEGTLIWIGDQKKI